MDNKKSIKDINDSDDHPPEIPPKPHPNCNSSNDNNGAVPPLVPPRPVPKPPLETRYYSPLSKVPSPQKSNKQQIIYVEPEPGTSPPPMPIITHHHKLLQTNDHDQQKFSMSLHLTPSVAVIQNQNPSATDPHLYLGSMVPGAVVDSENHQYLDVRRSNSSKNTASNNYPQQSSEYAEITSNLYDPIQLSSNRKELSEIIQSCDQLPMTVSFCDSIYGYGDGSFTFLNTEFFDIHFMKESFVANVETSRGGKFKVPLQVSGFKFQPSYSPDDICNTVYTSAQLMKLSQLPKIATVMKKYKVKKKHAPCDFKKGEVLLLKHRIGSKSIESISLTDNGCRKSIPKSSDLLFTANPSLTDQLMFNFSTLINFDLPIQAMIIAPVKFRAIFSSLSVIHSVSKETSVIASFNDPAQTALYEIFIDVPIDFQVCRCSSGQKQLLAKKSMNIYETFNPSKVQKIIVDTRSHHQQEIYQLPPQEGEDWKKVINIIRPCNDLIPKQQCNPTPNDSTAIHCPDNIARKQNCSSMISSHDVTNPPLHASNNDNTTSGTTAAIHPNLCYLPSSPTVTSQHTSHMQQNEYANKSPTLNSTTDNIAVTGDKLLSNIIRLEDLSPDQVLDLLDKVGLSRYKENFCNENISGGLLKELDADVLQNELGITSKLHRIKLLRIIEGRELIDNYFD